VLEEEIRRHPERFRVLTGDRPTGPLHLGHYLGTLANRVRLQQAGVEVFLVIADYQVITDRDVVGELSRTVRELILDYLAAHTGRADGNARANAIADDTLRRVREAMDMPYS
jgi:tryptophanyl-tRNA synthetase